MYLKYRKFKYLSVHTAVLWLRCIIKIGHHPKSISRNVVFTSCLHIFGRPSLTKNIYREREVAWYRLFYG